MEKRTTRDKILLAALDLFSEKGYDGVGVDLIAERVGLKGPSIYRHFKSKEDLFDSLVTFGQEYYFNSIKESYKDVDKIETFAQLMEMSKQHIMFAIKDSTIVKYRRILKIEQFHYIKIANLANLHFTTLLEDLYENSFAVMIDKGIIKKYDPKILAMAYLSPVSTLIHQCDRMPELEEEIVDKINKYILHFSSVYSA